MDLDRQKISKALSHEIKVGDESGREILLEKLVEGLYNRNDIELKAGKFSVRGDVVDLFPAYANHPIRVEFWGMKLKRSVNST